MAAKIPFHPTAILIWNIRFWLLFTGAVACCQPAGAEARYLDCLRYSYPEAAGILDSLMASYEQGLIDLGLLESRNAADYRGLLQRIASGQRIELGDNPTFGERLRGLERDSLAWRSCVSSLEQYKATHPEARLTRFLDRRDVMLLEEISADLQAAALLDILGEADLEEPFYRLQTYYILDMQAQTPVTISARPEALFRERELYATRGANVMNIYLNEKDQTLVGDQLTDPTELAENLSRHARRFGPEAIYTIELELDVKYRQLVALKDQIALAVSAVRDQYARRVFGKTLTELSETERELVEDRYPLRVVTP